MKIPENLLYTLEHEWADFKKNIVIIGITDYAQSQLGDIIFVELPEIGSVYNSGDIFGEIEAVKTVSDLYAPISGKIIEVNDNIEINPELVNSDPYVDGWLIKIEPSHPKEKEELLSFNAYKNSLE